MSEPFDLEINIDLKERFYFPVMCKQNDDINLIFNVYDNSVAIDLSNFDCRLRALKSDRKPLIQCNNISINKNVVTIAVDKQLTTTSGIVQAELQLIDKTTNFKKHSFNITIRVISSVLEVDRTISKATYDLLTELEYNLDKVDGIEINWDRAEELNTSLIAQNNSAASNISKLKIENDKAPNNIGNLKLENNRADINIPNLKNENDNADDKLDKFRLYDTTNLIEQVQENTASLNQNTQQISNLSINKAEKTDVADALELKANKTDVYDKNEIDSNLSLKATINDLEVQKARIDSFTSLPSGSTTGDAELIDGRIGAEGENFSNIGNSIRNQIKGVKNSLNTLLFEWEQGTVDQTYGLVANTTRIRTKNRIYFPNYIMSNEVYLYIPDGYKMYICEYDNSTIITSTVSLIDFSNGFYKFVVKNKYYRFVLAKNDDTSITIAEGTAYIATGKIFQYVDRFLLNDDFVNYKELVKNSFDTFLIEWTQGTVDQTYGLTDSTTRIRTKDRIYFANLTDREYVYIYIPKNYKMYVCEYDDATIVTSTVTLINFSDGLYKFIFKNKYYRFVLAKSDNSNITIEDNLSFVSDGKYLKQVDIIDAAKSVSENTLKDFTWINGTVINNGGQYDGNITSSDNRLVSDYYYTGGIDTYIRVEVPDGIKVIYILYDTAYTTDYGSSSYISPFINEDFVINMTPNKAIRFIISKEDNSTITPSYESNVEIKKITATAFKAFNNNKNFENYLNIRTQDGWSELEKKILDKAKAYKISNSDTRTLTEISEWLLNKDNCIYRGRLQKIDNKLCDKNGAQLEIRGVGLHHLLNYTQLHTYESFRTLKYYGVNCIRISAYLSDISFSKSGGYKMQEGGQGYGYLSHPSETKAEIDKIISYCTQLGLYVIIDWHTLHTKDGDVTQYNNQMQEFFTYFAQKYANYDNVLYEIQNEPYQNSASSLLTSINLAINTIKTYVTNPIIICGQGQDWTGAMLDLVASNNLDIFVSPHYYITTDTPTKESIDDLVTNYFAQNKPIFITEWGNAESSGDGATSDELADYFMEKIHSYKINQCVWKLTYQPMTTSILTYTQLIDKNIYADGGYTNGSLSHNGRFYFDRFESYAFD